MWSTDVFTSVFVVKALNQPWHWFNFWWRLSRFSVDDTVVRNYGCFTGWWFCFFISWDLEAIAAYNAVKVWVVLSSPVSPGREWCFLVFTGTDLEKESRKWTAGWLVCSSNEGGPDTGLHALFSTKAYQTKQNSLLASSRFFSPLAPFISLSQAVCFFEPIKSFSCTCGLGVSDIVCVVLKQAI